MAWLENRKGTWFVCYRDECRKTQRVNASTDKQVAKAMLGEYQTKEMRGEKYSDPFKDSRARPLGEHIADFLADLRAKGRDSMYVYNVQKRLAKLVEALQWKKLEHITADSFCNWRETPIEMAQAGTKEDRHIGPTTLNQYLEAIRTFCNWAVKRKRMAANPMLAVEKIEESADVRRDRRAFAVEELTALMKAAEPEHQRVYRFILGTGLRRQEVADLIWDDIHEGATQPFVKLRAKATKSRRADVLPLRQDLAQELAAARGEAAGGDRVFRDVPSMYMHQKYLKAAGIAFEDEQGRRADFHALRHTFGTMLSKAGVAPRVAMELMRHTDLRLTMKVYTDPRVFDLGGAVEKLPVIPADTAESAAKKTASR